MIEIFGDVAAVRFSEIKGRACWFWIPCDDRRTRSSPWFSRVECCRSISLGLILPFTASVFVSAIPVADFVHVFKTTDDKYEGANCQCCNGYRDPMDLDTLCRFVRFYLLEHFKGRTGPIEALIVYMWALPRHGQARLSRRVRQGTRQETRQWRNRRLGRIHVLQRRQEHGGRAGSPTSAKSNCPPGWKEHPQDGSAHHPSAYHIEHASMMLPTSSIMGRSSLASPFLVSVSGGAGDGACGT